MAKAIIGEPYTFSVLFLDPLNNPVDPPDPTIEVFYYTDPGVKVNVVAPATPMVAVTPPEVGRYTYNMTIPGSLDVRFMLYGVMRGTDPHSTLPIVVEQEIDLWVRNDGTGTQCGLRASFVKDGRC